MKKVKTSLRQIKDAFGVLDALNGSVSGNYEKDLAEAKRRRKAEFDLKLYQEAEMMLSCP